MGVGTMGFGGGGGGGGGVGMEENHAAANGSVKLGTFTAVDRERVMELRRMGSGEWLITGLR